MLFRDFSGPMLKKIALLQLKQKLNATKAINFWQARKRRFWSDCQDLSSKKFDVGNDPLDMNAIYVKDLFVVTIQKALKWSTTVFVIPNINIAFK